MWLLYILILIVYILMLLFKWTQPNMFLVAYDVTSEQSFNAFNKWFERCRAQRPNQTIPGKLKCQSNWFSSMISHYNGGLGEQDEFYSLEVLSKCNMLLMIGLSNHTICCFEKIYISLSIITSWKFQFILVYTSLKAPTPWHFNNCQTLLWITQFGLVKKQSGEIL